MLAGSVALCSISLLIQSPLVHECTLKRLTHYESQCHHISSHHLFSLRVMDVNYLSSMYICLAHYLPLLNLYCCGDPTSSFKTYCFNPGISTAAELPRVLKSFCFLNFSNRCGGTTKYIFGSEYKPHSRFNI